MARMRSNSPATRGEGNNKRRKRESIYDLRGPPRGEVLSPKASTSAKSTPSTSATRISIKSGDLAKIPKIKLFSNKKQKVDSSNETDSGPFASRDIARSLSSHRRTAKSPLIVNSGSSSEVERQVSDGGSSSSSQDVLITAKRPRSKSRAPQTPTSTTGSSKKSKIKKKSNKKKSSKAADGLKSRKRLFVFDSSSSSFSEPSSADESSASSDFYIQTPPRTSESDSLNKTKRPTPFLGHRSDQILPEFVTRSARQVKRWKSQRRRPIRPRTLFEESDESEDADTELSSSSSSEGGESEEDGITKSRKNKRKAKSAAKRNVLLDSSESDSEDNPLSQLGRRLHYDVVDANYDNESSASDEDELALGKAEKSQTLEQRIYNSRSKRKIFYYTHQKIFSPLLPSKPKKANYFQKTKRPVNMPNMVPRRTEIKLKGLNATLKDYQEDGLSFLVWLRENGIGGFLGDEMGLGKTIQSIALILWALENEPHCETWLVICPLTVLDNWLAELHKFAPGLRALRFYGNKAERALLANKAESGEPFNVVVTTYDTCMSEAPFFLENKWEGVILDEGHKIKNDATRVAKTLEMIPTATRVILSGTPIQNNLKELWALLHFCFPEMFIPATADKFNEAFDLSHGNVNKSFLNNCRELLKLIMLRRLKSDVNFEVPDRKEIEVYLPLTPYQKYHYTRLLNNVDTETFSDLFDNYKDSINSKTSESLETPSPSEQQEPKQKQYRRLMSLLTELRKCCDHPFLLDGAEPVGATKTDYCIASGKMIFLDKLLDYCVQDNHRCLIFSSFTQVLDVLEEFMSFKKIRAARIDGSLSRARRSLDVHLFNQKNSPFHAFLMSTRAASHGLNLTTADIVVMFDSDWNPQINLQAIARAHRLGQTKEVKVYTLICRGTVEEQMMGRIKKKLYLSTKVTEKLHDQNNQNQPGLSSKQLQMLIRRGAAALGEDLDANKFYKADLEELVEQYGKGIDASTDVEESGVSPEDEEKWLKVVERVQTKLYEGELRSKPQQPSGFGLDDGLGLHKNEEIPNKRISIRRITKVQGYDVLTDSLTPENGRSTPTSENKRTFGHQLYCQLCLEGADEKESLIGCGLCPRSAHESCTDGSKWAEINNSSRMRCSQHQCVLCDKSSAQASGMLFRCRGCVNAYCEDCLDFEKTNWVGDSLPEMVKLDYVARKSVFWIQCPDCVEYFKKNPEEYYTTDEFDTAVEAEEMPSKVEIFLKSQDDKIAAEKKREEERKVAKMEREMAAREEARRRALGLPPVSPKPANADPDSALGSNVPAAMPALYQANLSEETGGKGLGQESDVIKMGRELAMREEAKRRAFGRTITPPKPVDDSQNPTLSSNLSTVISAPSQMNPAKGPILNNNNIERNDTSTTMQASKNVVSNNSLPSYSMLKSSVTPVVQNYPNYTMPNVSLAPNATSSINPLLANRNGLNYRPLTLEQVQSQFSNTIKNQTPPGVVNHENAINARSERMVKVKSLNSTPQGQIVQSKAGSISSGKERPSTPQQQQQQQESPTRIVGSNAQDPVAIDSGTEDEEETSHPPQRQQAPDTTEILNAANSNQNIWLPFQLTSSNDSPANK